MGLVLTLVSLKTETSLRVMTERWGFGRRGNVGKEKPIEQPSVSDEEETEIPDEPTTVSPIRQNFHPDIEARLNKQINLELQACYNFRSMGVYFNSDDVALPGFSKFFFDLAEQKKKHATRIMIYVNRRGGNVVYDDIEKPATGDWGTGLKAMRTSLDLVMSLNEVLLKLHEQTIKLKDPVTDLFVKKHLCIHVRIIKKLGGHVTNLKRVGPKLGEYIFGQKTLKAEDIESDVSSDCDD